MNVRMELNRVIIQETSQEQFIFLKERDGDRSFPIVIGMGEALAIDFGLKGHAFPRPMTHDLVHNVIDALGGTLKKIVIHDLQDHTFLATLTVRRGEELIEIDFGR